MVSTRSSGRARAKIKSPASNFEATSGRQAVASARASKSQKSLTPREQTAKPRQSQAAAASRKQKQFLKSSGVHTRSEGPVPAISLSTELPAALQLRSESLRAEPEAAQHDRAGQQRKYPADKDAEDLLAEQAGKGSFEADLDADKARSEHSSELDDREQPAELTMLDDQPSRRSNDQQGVDPGALQATAAETHRPLAGSEDGADEEAVWLPQTGLPNALRTEDVEASLGTEAAEPGLNKQFMAPPRDGKQETKARKAHQQRNWHDLPETPITDEVKRDLRLLRLRGAMDPKRFYKKADKGRFPARFAIGTVVEGPAEFYSGRLSNKQRKQTITEELLADPQLQSSNKRRFNKLQEERSRWGHKKHRGSGERVKKRPKRPKHLS